MLPAYLPGDVLRTSDQNLWTVGAMTGDTIYTLYASTVGQPVIRTLMITELRRMGAEKVARMPEDVRQEATDAALAALERGDAPERALSILWDLAFLTGWNDRMPVQ